MKREIKFRGYVAGKMIYNINISNRGYMINDENDIEDSIVMQFTGLHDRNGVEIYEGDVIGIHKVSGGVCRVGYCVLEKGKYVNKYKGTSFTDEIGIYGYLQKIEVIGNIHQNPELLNATT